MSDGTFKPGDKLPTEEVLANTFNVSRMTVNKALRDLSNLGYIVRKPGLGSFVNTKRYEDTSDNLIGFAEYMNLHNIETHSILLAQEKILPPKQVAELLNISTNTPVFRIERLRQAYNEPFVLQIAWIIEHFCPDLLEYDFTSESLYQTIYKLSGQHVSSAKDQVEAIGASYRLAKLLEVPYGFPILSIVRKSFFDHNVPIELSYSWYRSDRYELTVEYH